MPEAKGIGPTSAPSASSFQVRTVPHSLKALCFFFLSSFPRRGSRHLASCRQDASPGRDASPSGDTDRAILLVGLLAPFFFRPHLFPLLVSRLLFFCLNDSIRGFDPLGLFIFAFFSCVFYFAFSPVLCVLYLFVSTRSFRWRTKGPRCRCEGERIVPCVCRVSFFVTFHSFSDLLRAGENQTNQPQKNRQKQKTNDLHHPVEPLTRLALHNR